MKLPPREEVPSLFGTSVLAGLGFGSVLESLDVLWFDGEPWSWGDLALRVAVCAVVFAGFVLGGWMSSPPAPEELAVRRLLATGVLPPDADGVAWRGSLEAERTRLLRERWSGPVRALAVAGLVALAAVRSPGPDVGVWALAVVGVVLAVVDRVVTHRRLRLIDRSTAQLAGRR